MNKTIIQNKYFFYPYIAFLILGFALVFIHSKSFLHLAINQHHNVYADYFFKYITHLGNGFFVFGIGIVYMLFELRKGLVLLVSFISSGLLVQFLKHFVFEEMMRPKAFFENSIKLHMIKGVDVHAMFSFPSGHATAAFALFLSMALFSNKSIIKLFCIIGASLVAFSRVYISQHFLIDILVGSVIAVLITIIFYHILGKSNKNWLKYSIIYGKK
jgi:membrane-associated phospholipid phosphatase